MSSVARRVWSLLLVAFVLLTSACQSDARGSAPATGSSSATVPPAAAGQAAPSAALPPAPANTSGRKEVTLVAGPRRRLEETFTALQQGDIAAARAAFEAYNGDWNGVEVYVNYRSRALYGEIETHYEADIAEALGKANPDTTQIIPMLQTMVSKYDEAIRLSDSGPALSPLFDDVALIRTVRAPLRHVSP